MPHFETGAANACKGFSGSGFFTYHSNISVDAWALRRANVRPRRTAHHHLSIQMREFHETSAQYKRRLQTSYYELGLSPLMHITRGAKNTAGSVINMQI